LDSSLFRMLLLNLLLQLLVVEEVCEEVGGLRLDLLHFDYFWLFGLLLHLDFGFFLLPLSFGVLLIFLHLELIHFFDLVHGGLGLFHLQTDHLECLSVFPLLVQLDAILVLLRLQMIQHGLQVLNTVGNRRLVLFRFQRGRQRLPRQHHSYLLYLILDLTDFLQKRPISRTTLPEHSIVAGLIHLLLPGRLLRNTLFCLRLEILERIFFAELLNVVGNPCSFQGQAEIDCIYSQHFFEHPKAN